jgi:hypothetical protein
MLESSLLNFKKEIINIKDYIKHINLVNTFADLNVGGNNEDIKKLDIKQHFIDFNSQKKIFEYKALIISLYGLLERQVDIWIKEYLNINSSFTKDYSDYEESFKNKHFELSLKLLTTITNKDLSKLQHLKKEEILKNLNDCLTNPANYKLNTESFLLSTGNLKHNKINEIFSQINIQLNDGLKKNESFKTFIGRPFDNTHNSITFAKIDDLVDRRNEIAHGSEKIDDILDNSEIITIIDFVENYCIAIFEILEEQHLKQESEINWFKLNSIKKIWGARIIGFEIENYEIKNTDFLLIKTNDNRYYKKSILSIEINKEPYTEIEITSSTDIAISVDFPLNINQTFFLSKKD